MGPRPRARLAGEAVDVVSRWAPALALVAMTACADGARDSATGGAGGDGGGVSPRDGSAPVDAGTNDRTAGDGDAAGPNEGGPIDAAADGGRDFSTDRSRFFGASRCDDAGLQLCEDFEKGTLNKSIWTIAGGAPVIDGAEHARGSKALHVKVNGNGQSAIRERSTFPEPGNTYFGRMFVYFKSLPAPPAMTYAHWTIVAASGTSVAGEIRVSGQLQQGRNLFGVGTDNRTDAGNATGDWTNSDRDPNGSPMAVPVGQWICLEWMHKGDTNETAFWWDGVNHPSLSTSATMHGGNSNPYELPHFTNLWLGWQEYQNSTESFELWIDEIALDPGRIGCVL